MNNAEKLEECGRCQSLLCVVQNISEDVNTRLCLKCGYTTSTLLTEGSEVTQQLLERSPELYKELMFKDKENFLWFPATLSVPNVGIVFVDGTTVQDWKWGAAKARPVTKDDKNLVKGQTHKMDMKNIKHFNQNEFLEACNEAKIFG